MVSELTFGAYLYLSAMINVFLTKDVSTFLPRSSFAVCLASFSIPQSLLPEPELRNFIGCLSLATSGDAPGEFQVS